MQVSDRCPAVHQVSLGYIEQGEEQRVSATAHNCPSSNLKLELAGNLGCPKLSGSVHNCPPSVLRLELGEELRVSATVCKCPQLFTKFPHARAQRGTKVVRNCLQLSATVCKVSLG